MAVAAGSGVLLNPTAGQTITQPSNTNFNIALSGSGLAEINGIPIFNSANVVPYTSGGTGGNYSSGVTALNGLGSNGTGDITFQYPFAATSVTNVVNVELAPGADLGAKLRSAITAQGSGWCGTYVVPAGNYTWSTPSVIMPTCQTLEGNGALVSVSSMTHPALIVAGIPQYDSPSDPNPLAYINGGVRDITFEGPGPNVAGTTGIFIGGDPNGVITPASYNAFLLVMYNIHVAGFSTGIEFGATFQDAFFGGSIENNNVGIGFENITFGVENLNFHGTQILNNLQYGVYNPNSGYYAELNFTDCSIDYNDKNAGGTNIVQANGKVMIQGGHMEGTKLPFIDIPTPIINSQAVFISLSDVSLDNTDPTASDTYQGFIVDQGFASQLHMGKGITISVSAAAVPGFLYLSPVTNGNLEILAEPWFAYTPNGNYLQVVSQTLPAQVDNYNYPTYSANGAVYQINHGNFTTLTNITTEGYPSQSHMFNGVMEGNEFPVGPSSPVGAWKPNSLVVEGESTGGLVLGTNTGAGSIYFVPNRTGGAYMQSPGVMTYIGTQTISGCGLTGALGGASRGAFASGTSGTCTVTITPGITAQHGFSCWANDMSNPTYTVKQTAYTTTTAQISGTTVSGDAITWGCDAF